MAMAIGNTLPDHFKSLVSKNEATLTLKPNPNPKH